MTYRHILDSEQLAALTRILDDYCEQSGIEGSHPAREQLARRLFALFRGGIDSPDDVKMALDRVSIGDRSQDRLVIPLFVRAALPRLRRYRVHHLQIAH